MSKSYYMDKRIVALDAVIATSVVALALAVGKVHSISNSFSFFEGTSLTAVFLIWPYKRAVMWGRGHWPKPWWIAK